MSVTTTAETLVTCPVCGQAGFTPQGLAAHRGSRHCANRAAVASLPEARPEVAHEATADPAIELVDPKTLRAHPLLEGIPLRREDDPEFVALLDDVRLQGFLNPAQVDTQDRILCGRHRVRIAERLGRRIPVRRVPDGQAAQIILSELVLERHLSKSALAYLAVPLLEPALKEAQERRIAALKQGTRFSPSHDNIVSREETGPTVAGIAARLNISHDLLSQARKLRELLAKVAQLRGAEPARAIADQVLSGALNLGYAITAATNYTTDKTSGGNTGKRHEHARLFKQSFGKVVLHWGQATPRQREQIADDLREIARTADEGLRAEIRKAFRA